MFVTLQSVPFILLGLAVAYYLVPYLQKSHLRDIPSAGFAAFTNVWLLLQARQGKKYLTIDEAHKKYGKLVRISPTQVSIADDEAILSVYGHGNGFLKAYVNIAAQENCTQTDDILGTSTMPSSLSAVACSTPVTVLSTPANARPFPTLSVPSPLANSSNISMAMSRSL